ncbi:beta-1,3-galactosyltransferase 5-like [Rhopilema esculentum]|uniref:beta-1,3-galactosyltransferase 5-like n=1 Tax=Rhopilema esculentum TaxID=499914 RepID=UPI0031D8CBEF
MNTLTRRRLRKFVISGVVCLIFWTVSVLINEKPGISHPHSKAISPDRHDNKALRKAVESCNSDVMFDKAPASCNGQPFLLILVISSPNNIFRRDLIRKYLMPKASSTFYKQGPLWRIVFVVSKTNNHFLERKVAGEIASRGDIILGRYRDTSKNLVYKTLIGLGWAHCHCVPRYLLKANDNVFVNVRGLVHWLYKSNSSYLSDHLYMGILKKWHQSKPIREESSRYFVSRDDYPYDMYPPHVVGGAYLLSKDVLEAMIPLIRQIHAFGAEDAYIGMLAQLIGIQAKETNLFHEQSRPNSWSICSYPKVLISLGVSANDLPEIVRNSLRSVIECMNDQELFDRANIIKLIDFQ